VLLARILSLRWVDMGLVHMAGLIIFRTRDEIRPLL
jgi:hypothetical protein